MSRIKKGNIYAEEVELLGGLFDHLLKKKTPKTPLHIDKKERGLEHCKFTLCSY